MIRRARTDVRLKALRLRSRARDDVDHAIDSIDAPERSAGSADNLDALDLLERNSLLFPKHARKDRRVDVPSVHHDQQLGGETAVEPARSDSPSAGIQSRDLDARRKAQHFGQSTGTAAPNILAGNHIDSRRCIGRCLLALGSRRHGDIHAHQRSEIQFSQVLFLGTEACGNRQQRCEQKWKSSFVHQKISALFSPAP